MANSLQVQLSLNAQGFNKGMKEASESTRQYTNEGTKITKDLPNMKNDISTNGIKIKNLEAQLTKLDQLATIQSNIASLTTIKAFSSTDFIILYKLL